MEVKKKYIVVSEFANDSSFKIKLKNFHKRFSNAPIGCDFTLPFWAPLKLKNNINIQDAFLEIQEEIQSFYPNAREHSYIKFSDIQIYQHKRNYLLFLRPSFSEDLNYCLESLNSIKSEYFEIPKKKEVKPYLLLGKFNNLIDLEKALHEAQKEFITPVEVKVKSFSLFQKSHSDWLKYSSFIDFERNYDSVVINEKYHRMVV